MQKAVMAAALVAGLAVTGPALAGDFYPITIESEQVILLDLSSVVSEGAVTRVKFVWVVADAAGQSGETVGHIEVLEEFRCEALESRRVGMTTFAEDGRVLARSDTQMPWAANKPGTYGGTMVQTVCDPASRDPDQVASIPTADLVSAVREYMAEAD
ncbi:hypothetical protein GVN21_05090 [Caulobacter sp. SLTY]|uniref:surface-adhesin E family protein n=1 Tax=Caulobacter sp. SLTY TaxID=2683262 RepID=UPI001412A9AD|nr:surface-adhesin E family protein [Caulobacter sp. SLTY]NBB14737.1 hypothetical protein [Caulobacter sp. SLTY]